MRIFVFAAAAATVLAFGTSATSSRNRADCTQSGPTITTSEHTPLPGRSFAGAVVAIPARDCYVSLKLTCDAEVGGRLKHFADGVVHFVRGRYVKARIQFRRDSAVCSWVMPRTAGGQLFSLAPPPAVPCDMEGCGRWGVELDIDWGGGTSSVSQSAGPTWRVRPRVRPRFRVAAAPPRAGTRFRPVVVRFPGTARPRLKSVSCDGLLDGGYLQGRVERAADSVACSWAIPSSAGGKVFTLRDPNCRGGRGAPCCTDCAASLWGVSVVYTYAGWANPAIPAFAQYRAVTRRVRPAP